MMNEKLFEQLKWVLDFKALESIQFNGSVEVTVKELIEMSNEVIRYANETLQSIETGKINAEELKGQLKEPEQFVETMRKGAIRTINEANEVIAQLNNFDMNKTIRFEKGCN